MEEDYSITSNDIASLLLDVDGDLEICLESNEAEELESLFTLFEEDFILPDLPTIHSMSDAKSVQPTETVTSSAKNILCCKKCSKVSK